MSYWNRPWARFAKRAVDVCGAGAALVLLSPVLAGAAVAVLASMGRPIFFTHERAGHGGRPFRIIKFRTMRPPRPDEEMLHTDAARLTSVGAFLRKSSIDELPELINVLRGEMSLVGPRPLLLEYVAKYDQRQRLRLEVLPGITGWAQTNGRQNIPFSRRLELDAWYVENWSLVLDLQIILKTALGLVKPEGVISGQNIADVDDVGFFTPRAEA